MTENPMSDHNPGHEIRPGTRNDDIYANGQPAAQPPAKIEFTDAWAAVPPTAEQLAALEAEEAERAKRRSPLPGRGGMTGSVRHRAAEHTMDYIADTTLYHAVMCARWLIRQNLHSPYVACVIAARKFGVRREDVHHYVSQAAGRTAQRRRHSR